MTFTKESKELMKTFFDSLHKYSYNKKNTNTILETFHNKLINSYKFYDNKTVVKKTFKKVKNKSDIPSSTLLEGTFISNPCINIIYNKSKGLLKYTLNLQGVFITVYFTTFENTNFKIYDVYIRDIIVFLHFLFSFNTNDMPTEITYYLFLTDNKKELPKDGSILSSDNCNTGVTYGCQAKGEVLIYRKEEWFKVFIHESFHLLCLDFNSMDQTKINSSMQGIININSKYNLFEAYTEFWATIINSLFCAHKLYKKNKDKNFGLYMDFCLQFEKIFSLFQCSKVLDYMGLTYENLIHTSVKTQYKENTNVFAYYIIKPILLFFKDDFLLWCQQHNKSTIFDFIKSQENIGLFFNFIKDHLDNKDLLLDMRKSLKKLKEVGNGTYIHKTLRMTICNVKLM